MKIFAAVLGLFAVVAMSVLPVSTASAAAATNQTITITEAQINSSYAVTNPHLRSISNVSVDLQDGQAVLNATVTTRDKKAYNTVSVFKPVIRYGAVRWMFVSATVNGQAVPQEVLNLLNSSLYPNWRSVFQSVLARAIVGPFKVNSVSISGDAITLEITKYR